MNSSYQDLQVWNKAMDLVEETYLLVKELPKEELFGLSSQMRRAAVSIPSNIAEGKDRVTDKEFIRFLSIARGSAAELETQFLICERLGYIEPDRTETAAEHCREVGRMLHGLISSLATWDLRHETFKRNREAEAEMKAEELMQLMSVIVPVETLSSICIVTREDKNLLDSIKLCFEKKKNSKALVEHSYDGSYKVFSINQELFGRIN